MVDKWYSDIPPGKTNNRSLPDEPIQKEYREKSIERKVPSNAFYYAFKMVNRTHPDFYISDTLSDVLGQDKSSRLYLSLKKEQQLVSSISAYITGSIDDGLLIISGKMNDGVSFETLDNSLWKELEHIKSIKIEGKELTRIKNKIRTSKEFQDQGILNRAMNLSMYELLGDAEMINDESRHYQDITSQELQIVANNIFNKECCSLLKVIALKND